MRCKPTTFWRALAVALPAFVLAVSLTAFVRPMMAAEAGDDEGEEEDGQPRGRSYPDEPAAAPQIAPKRLGASRRPDPFDVADEPRTAARPLAPAAVQPDDGIVRCEAGCDGPRGTVVYKKKQPAG
jgi:hypothetical protein